MLDQGDGTYLAKFKIFVLEEAATGGNMVADKSQPTLRSESRVGSHTLPSREEEKTRMRIKTAR